MPRKPSLDKWLTAKEAGELLGIDAAGVRYLIRTGKFNNVQRVGVAYLVAAQEVEARLAKIAAGKIVARRRKNKKTNTEGQTASASGTGDEK